jgi:LysR family transcriptional regulator for bpeEF and oprC
MSVLYPQNRHLSPKVRAFADWVAELFSQCPLLNGSDGEGVKAGECRYPERHVQLHRAGDAGAGEPELAGLG